MDSWFREFAHRASEAAGSPWAFLLSLAGVVVWLVLGPVFDFSQPWLVSMGTICSIIPSLMVFLIQNMQNRDAKAMQLKLDELIRASTHARNALIHLEALSDQELDALETEFHRIRGSRQPPPGAPLRAEPYAADSATRSTSSP
jgi:low affinity Fe/Cu permease